MHAHKELKSQGVGGEEGEEETLLCHHRAQSIETMFEKESFSASLSAVSLPGDRATFSRQPS